MSEGDKKKRRDGRLRRAARVRRLLDKNPLLSSLAVRGSRKARLLLSVMAVCVVAPVATQTALAQQGGQGPLPLIVAPPFVSPQQFADAGRVPMDSRALVGKTDATAESKGGGGFSRIADALLPRLEMKQIREAGVKGNELAQTFGSKDSGKTQAQGPGLAANDPGAEGSPDAPRPEVEEDLGTLGLPGTPPPAEPQTAGTSDPGQPDEPATGQPEQGVATPGSQEGQPVTNGEVPSGAENPAGEPAPSPSAQDEPSAQPNPSPQTEEPSEQAGTGGGFGLAPEPGAETAPNATAPEPEAPEAAPTEQQPQEPASGGEGLGLAEGPASTGEEGAVSGPRDVPEAPQQTTPTSEAPPEENVDSPSDQYGAPETPGVPGEDAPNGLEQPGDNGAQGPQGGETGGETGQPIPQEGAAPPEQYEGEGFGALQPEGSQTEETPQDAEPGGGPGSEQYGTPGDLEGGSGAEPVPSQTPQSEQPEQHNPRRGPGAEQPPAVSGPEG